MEAVTHLYTYPDAIATESGRAEIDAALARLSAALDLEHAVKIRGGHSGRITVPDVSPDVTWAAIANVVPDWQQLFLPRPTD